MAHPHNAKPAPKPAPKLHHTKVPPPKAGEHDAKHDEKILDEAIDESFPASDPPAITQPHSSLAVKKIAEEGRATPEPDPTITKKKKK